MQFTGVGLMRMFALTAGINGLASVACSGSDNVQTLPYEQIVSGEGSQLDCSQEKFGKYTDEMYGANKCIGGVHNVPASDYDPKLFADLSNCVFGSNLFKARLPEEGTDEGKVGPKFGVLYLGDGQILDSGLTPIYTHGHSFSMVATSLLPPCFVGKIALHETMHSLQATVAYHVWASQAPSDAQEPNSDFSILGHGLDATGHAQPGTTGIMTPAPTNSCPASFSEAEALAILDNLGPAGLADVLGDNPTKTKQDILKRMTDVTVCETEWQMAVTAQPRN